MGNNCDSTAPYKSSAQLNFNAATWNITAVLDNVLDANENRIHAVNFQGYITDGFGTRPYVRWSWFDAAASEGVRERQQSTETPQRIVERNGCFFDAATNQWKSCMSFIDHNRLTGDYIVITFDVILVNFAASFLTANQNRASTSNSTAGT